MNDGFGLNAKKEAAAATMFSQSTRIAFAAGLIQAAGSIIISSDGIKISIKTDSPFVKEALDSVLKEVYKAESSFGSEKDIVLQGAYLQRLLLDCKILARLESGEVVLTAGIDPDIIRREQSAGAYIRGAFLGAGSVSVVHGYHLEFALTNNTRAEEICNLLINLGINAKIITRKEHIVVYVKGVEPISDLLALMGCSKAVMAINELFAMRQLTQLVNRRSNCDLANIDKSIDNAQEQLKIIAKLKSIGVLDKLDVKLKEAALARLDNTEASMAQLSQMLSISKSGLVHRFKKLKQIYQNHFN